LSSAEALRFHFHTNHPLELPVLYIRGAPLLRESVLRRRVAVEDVELVQCTRCELQTDGGPWRRIAIPEFRKEFTHPMDSTWNVRLVHERSVDDATTEEEYHVRFRIPEAAALTKVDERFIQTLVLDEVRHADLERFEAGLPPGAPAREYAGALGNYTLAILLKERRMPYHAPIGFERFAELMKEALEVLRLFSRPVALAICSSIRFNLNDFADHGGADEAEIATGLRLFRHIIAGSEYEARDGSRKDSSKPRSTYAICPVDQITHRLLTACAILDDGRRLSLSELESLRQLTRGMVPISEQDLAKVHVLCAEGYRQIDRIDDALPHLRAVQFVRPFNEWAQQHLN
jgi:hypothetical protein